MTSSCNEKPQQWKATSSTHCQESCQDKKKKLIAAICASLLAAPAADARIDLIAIGSLSGIFSDLAGAGDNKFYVFASATRIWRTSVPIIRRYRFPSFQNLKPTP
jgi:hypothetical protein